MLILLYMLSDMQINEKTYNVTPVWVGAQSELVTLNYKLEKAALAFPHSPRCKMQITARYKNIPWQDASGWNINQGN